MIIPETFGSVYIESCALKRDVVVFGVDIPVAEDEAGMVFIVGDEEFIDVRRPTYS